MRRRYLPLLLVIFAASSAHAQDAKALDARVSALRQMADSERGAATRQLALEIRALPGDANRTGAALHLAMLSTEGDFGQDTLQEVATTLADAVRTVPGKSAESAYQVLAEMERLEHVRVQLDVPKYAAAKTELQAASVRREKVDFSLKDLTGRTWKLSDLRGKVVLVNLWATWCPPCRKEMPDLDALAKELGPRGLVVLSLSDEDDSIVRKFLAAHPYKYPILLDTGGAIKKAYGATAIPKSYIYDRQGKIAAESIDMRTMRQFRALLAQAGLE